MAHSRWHCREKVTDQRELGTNPVRWLIPAGIVLVLSHHVHHGLVMLQTGLHSRWTWAYSLLVTGLKQDYGEKRKRGGGRGEKERGEGRRERERGRNIRIENMVNIDKIGSPCVYTNRNEHTERWDNYRLCERSQKREHGENEQKVIVNAHTNLNTGIATS